MKVLAVIVTYNGMKWADRCFSSLENSTLRPDVIVVDNGSSDGTTDYIKSHYPDTILIENDKNMGFGQANNKGLQYALDHGYDYVYLMNQDAWVMPDTLSQLTLLMDRHSDYGILSPMQLESNGERMDNNFCRLTLGRSLDFINDLYFNRQKEVQEVSFVMAAHWMISASCLRAVGGFSPTFYHYGEDNNYIERIHMHKLKVGIAPGVHAIHDRELRKKTKKDHVFFDFYNMWAINLSTPSHLNWAIEVRLLLDMLSKSIEYKSWQPFKDWLRLLKLSGSIHRNRKTSMEEPCAFLKPNRS